MVGLGRFRAGHVVMRLRQISTTGRRVLVTEGPWVFTERVIRWLRGERGYHRTLMPVAIDYAAFSRQNEPGGEALAQQRKSARKHSSPWFEIITHLPSSYREADLRATRRSLSGQTYQHYHWHILKSDESAVLTSEFVVPLGLGDSLAPDALYVLADYTELYPDAQIFYSDTDVLNEHGERCNPFFKPDWSPEMMLSVNLLEHLAAFRRDLWDEVAVYSDPWERAFYATARTNAIVHIPRVLYHRRASSSPARLDAIQRHLESTGRHSVEVRASIDGQVEARWSCRERLISIIIPSRDQPALIETCLQGLFTKTDYPQIEVIVVDTGSVQQATFDIYEHYARHPRFRLMSYSGEFNFSKACNLGAADARGEALLFLNNDVEVLHSDWLHRLAQWLEISEVAIVGPKLLFPDGHIQHGGIVIGLHGLTDNLFSHADDHISSPMGSTDWVRNFMAVTGACLLIRRSVFDQLGGFDERYRLLFSDVDLCVRVHEAGHRIVYTPHVRLLHHESATHQRRDPNIEDHQLAFTQFDRWLRSGDPFYNPNLTTRGQFPSLKQDQHDTPLLNRPREYQ